MNGAEQYVEETHCWWDGRGGPIYDKWSAKAFGKNDIWATTWRREKSQALTAPREETRKRTSGRRKSQWGHPENRESLDCGKSRKAASMAAVWVPGKAWGGRGQAGTRPSKASWEGIGILFRKVLSRWITWPDSCFHTLTHSGKPLPSSKANPSSVK